MKPEILIPVPIMQRVADALEDSYTVHRLDKADDRAGLLASVAPGVRGVATMGVADAALMDALPGLEIISSFGVGYDGVDVAHAAGKGIVVTNTPDVLNDEVANTAIMLLLAVSRKLVLYDRYVRDGRWVAEGSPPLTQAIRNTRIGILGLGRIGQDIARKLEMFGCTVAYHGRRKQDDQPYEYFADLVGMARSCDTVIAICPGGEATRGIVNRSVLDALGPNGTFINIARGSVHDEPALVAALQEGTLGFAGLDVFADEPSVPEELFAMDNVVLQPHQGSATVQTRNDMADLVVNNLDAHFAGKPVLTPVTE